MGGTAAGPDPDRVAATAPAQPRHASEFAHAVPPPESPWPASKKKNVHATERDTARVRLARRQYRQQIAQYPVKRLKFLDESGLNIALTRRYGRAVRGQRVQDAVPRNFGRNVSIVGTLSCYGMDAVMTIEGAVDGPVFRAYVGHVLAPTLRPGDVVVMDNLSVHKVQNIESLVTATGAQLIYLPPYSPDYSPIEHCWSKLKTWLRGMKARSRDALDQALMKIIPRISNQDSRAWFAHCGYSLN
jgi:transposase